MFYRRGEENSEYYVVNPDGVAFIPLRRDDRVEVTDFYGGQCCELAFYGANGGGGAHSANGKKLRKVELLEKTFLKNREKMRHKLDYAGICLSEFNGYRLFDGDSRPGESVSYTVQDDNMLLAIAAAYRKMPVDGDSPSAEIFVKVKRNLAAEETVDFRVNLPDPTGEIRDEFLVDRCTARAYRVARGDYIQIIDMHGRQCSDFIAFHEEDLQRGKESPIDATTTRTLAHAAYPMPGLLSKYYDNDQRPLMEVVVDTIGRHDTFGLACSPKYYEDVGYPGHLSCSENFNLALKPFGVASRAGWPAINLFFNTGVDCHNQIFSDEPWSRPGDHVIFRALRDIVCVSSACPDDLSPSNGWNPTDIFVRIYKGHTAMNKMHGRRVTADSPVQMTRQSGFHARTSALTRDYAEYNGFWMPTKFNNHGLIDEYWACRQKAAMMDLSALRKFEITGIDAEKLLNRAFTRDMTKLAVGQVVYTALCYPSGGMLDDGTLYRLRERHFRWIGGGDYGGRWLRDKSAEWNLDARVKPSTDELNNLAVQGPNSRDLLRKIIWTGPQHPTIDELRWFRFTPARLLGENGVAIVLSRTGFTGELGFEIFCHPDDAPAVWDTVWEAGKEFGLTPMGLEALDVLRIEAGLIVAGGEFCDQTDPFEAGIGFTVPAQKPADFVGKDALCRRRESAMKKLVGLEIEGREAACHGNGVYHGKCQIGEITSAAFSPVLDKNIALARVDIAFADLGCAMEVGKLDGEQKRLPAVVVPFPFYDPQKSRVRA